MSAVPGRWGRTAGEPVLGADRTACLGAGQCVLAAPDLFDQDEDVGLVLVLRPYPTEAQLPQARRAVDACPNRAIALHAVRQ